MTAVAVPPLVCVTCRPPLIQLSALAQEPLRAAHSGSVHGRRELPDRLDTAQIIVWVTIVTAMSRAGSEINARRHGGEPGARQGNPEPSDHARPLKREPGHRNAATRRLPGSRVTNGAM